MTVSLDRVTAPKRKQNAERQNENEHSGWSRVMKERIRHNKEGTHFDEQKKLVKEKKGTRSLSFSVSIKYFYLNCAALCLPKIQNNESMKRQICAKKKIKINKTKFHDSSVFACVYLLSSF